MAQPLSGSVALRTVALLTGGVLLLAGCASEGADPEAASAAPSAVPTLDAETSPQPTPPDSPGPQASASPPASEETPTDQADEDEAGQPDTEGQARDLVITIIDFAYQLPESVPPGSTVTVVNEDSAAHTVTSTGAFALNLTGGQTGTFTAPEEPGEYPVFCLFHGNMSGTLVVG